MSGGNRFLFVVPPLAGHVRPTVPVGRALNARGHSVAWAGHPEIVGELDALSEFIPVAETIPIEVATAVEMHTTRGTRGIAAFKSSWEEFVLPIARQMMDGVRAAIDTFSPDVVVVDQQALAGAAAAELRGLPWATSATTSAELLDPLATLPKVRDWLRGQLTAFGVEAGLDPDHAAAIDPRVSPHLVLAFTSRDLVGPTEGLPDRCELVGPSISLREDVTPFPWDWFDGPGPHVLVSLGTLHWRSGRRFFSVVTEALSGMAVRAVVVAPADLLPGAPDNVLVRPRVPQVSLMPHLDAVVSHGGHNTVCESLAFGHPLVIAPIRDDQPFVADQVTRAGAGRRVMFSRVTPGKLRDALDAVLTDPSYRAAAERLRSSFESAGGAPAAADHLEGLLGRVGSTGRRSECP